ncbi:ABC transporter ATP-binding protein [Dactylosporangium sp. NPDC005572]|uniref:ABC transporter ATP-binding protein n=1 Tax=Dactylosporangium sp. NPDC005572 TaxID=3156889 RepID=UPI0033AC8748
MTALSVRNLTKHYGRSRILDRVGLDVAEGTTTTILGPSGCGKTTFLRLVAGFDRADDGTISLDGQVVSAVPPERRNIGYVAQEGALFPHLTVEGNVAFGLARSDGSRAQRRRRVAEVLDLVRLDPALARRHPHQLSGGQQQRVALARALARRPALVLLDEPFSSLDTGLRAATRAAITDALRASGVTTLLVTHDQTEALSLSDQVAVLNHGAFTQVGPAREVYAAPADLDTARLLGPGTALPATVTAGTASSPLGTLAVAHPCPDGAATVFVRPEQLRVTPTPTGTATVRANGFLGADTILTLELPDGTRLDARADAAVACAAGDRVTVDVAGPVLVYPARSALPASPQARLVTAVPGHH